MEITSCITLLYSTSIHYIYIYIYGLLWYGECRYNGCEGRIISIGKCHFSVVDELIINVDQNLSR